MSNNNATAQLLMRRYGDIADVIPGENTLAKDLSFDTRNKLGELYYFPVRLGLELGATFNVDHSAYTLNTKVDGVYKDAQIDSAEITLRATLSYGEMHKLSASKGRSDKAYDQGIGLKLANLMDGAEMIRDAQLFYGSGTTGVANLGVINAVAVAASSGVVTVNITRQSWMAGFWQDAKNLRVDVYSSGGTQRNTNAALQVTAVDPSNCRVQLTGNTADAAAVAATDQLFFYNARSTSMFGLQAICENTGTLFNIDAAANPQWKAVSYPVGSAPLSFDKVAEGIAGVADNGLKEGLNLYVNTRQWTDLVNDEVALRRYLGKDSDKASPGFSEIEFTMACGKVKIKPHRYVKQGLAFGIPTSKTKRVGSTDLTFRAPGNPNEFFFRELDQNNGSEVRIYSDQAVICEAPFHMVLFSGIESASDQVPG